MITALDLIHIVFGGQRGCDVTELEDLLGQPIPNPPRRHVSDSHARVQGSGTPTVGQDHLALQINAGFW
jgi:hypothetical protein